MVIARLSEIKFFLKQKFNESEVKVNQKVEVKIEKDGN